MSEEVRTNQFETCGFCDHSAAYHDGDGGRPCRAFDPDFEDPSWEWKCACKGWKKPNPKIAAVANDEQYEPNGW